ncbi:cytochrome P450 [Cyathus striatus]|nr:cytochrome P450 [Cyathus striatus]
MLTNSPTLPFSIPYAPSTDLSVALGLLVVLIYLRLSYLNPRHHYPPGPKPLPFIGNAHQLKMGQLEVGFSEWHAVYGDVIYLRVFGQPLVILNTLKAARDLLDKRSRIYSDRPRFVLLTEMMGWENASTHAHYGPQFRKHRRFINSTFNQRVVEGFQPLQRKETLNLLENMLDSPNAFLQHFRRFAGATIMKITYGFDIGNKDRQFVELSERAIKLTVESGSPAATLVDFFPLMKHIPTWAPFSSFKCKALQTRRAVVEMFNVPFEKVKADVLSGTSVPSYTASLLQRHYSAEENSFDAEDEAIIKGSAGTLYAAAEDTTGAALESFLLAMILHPNVLKKAQAEMDEVIGGKRLPVLEDRDSLPYLECVAKEVLRWNSPVPLGMPHRLMEDDYYRDYHIPKGATVFANIYEISKECDNPDLFRPERYIEDPSLVDPQEFAFGFGRRKCPGRYLAYTSYWLIIANMVATFDISPSINEDGKEVLPELEFVSSFVRHVKSFKCSIKPRFQSVESLISDAKLECEDRSVPTYLNADFADESGDEF